MYKWYIRQQDLSNPAWLSRQAVDPLTRQVLSARGIDDEESVEKFLFPDIDRDEHDPFLLAGMDVAVKRIRQGLEAGERILVHGDYDADGLTSTTVLVRALRQLTSPDNVFTYIPAREEGYGVGEEAIFYAQSNGVTLLITVDCGITACDEIDLAQSRGIDVIISDHHTPPDILPSALSIINPKLAHCNYPYKDLAGVGVAYKIAHALLGKEARYLLPYVAVGTIADLVPLQGENRLYCREGLNRLNQQLDAYPGLAALWEVSGAKSDIIEAGQVGYALAPRLNAPGRLTTAQGPLQLLLEDDPESCRTLAEVLDEANRQRQETEALVVEEALALADPERKGLVLFQDHWQHGVVGIAASRLVDKFYRPTVILGRDEDGLLRGSGRSISGFNLVDALRQCEAHLVKCGGHAMAAGLTLREEHLQEFMLAFESVAATLSEESFVRTVSIDAEVDLNQLTETQVLELDLLAPFGMGNPTPNFVARGARVTDKREVGKTKEHLRLLVQSENMRKFGAIMFRHAPRIGELKDLESISLVFKPVVDEYRGSRSISLHLKDFACTTDHALWLITNPTLADKYFNLLPAELQLSFLKPAHSFTPLYVERHGDLFLEHTEAPVEGLGKPILMTPFITQQERQLLKGFDYFTPGNIMYNGMEVRRKLAPRREDLAQFYRNLQSLEGVFLPSTYVRELGLSQASGLSFIGAMFTILNELNLLTYGVKPEGVFYSLTEAPEKKDINDSATFKALSEWQKAEEEKSR